MDPPAARSRRSCWPNEDCTRMTRSLWTSSPCFKKLGGFSNSPRTSWDWADPIATGSSWRRSLNLLTSHLIENNWRCRWGAPRS
eukprot:223614-Pyramimonas_sp.AAC.1